jgi:hypothetical protein
MRIFPELTVDQEFQQLASLNYTGSLNDKQYYYLLGRNYRGALADMFKKYQEGELRVRTDLFSASEQGVWFEPDPTTTFTDTAGTTPAQVGQAVALMLDKSEGLVLGPELLSAGAVGLVGTATAATYSTSTGAGTVSRVDANNQSFVRWSSLSNTSNYKLRVICTSGNISIRAGDASAPVFQTLTAGQSFDGFVVPAGGFLTITNAPLVGTSGFTVTSVRELAGNHATQATLAARPILARVPASGRRNLFERTEEFDNAWAKTRTSVAVNTIAAPNGTLTADKLVEDATTNTTHFVGRTIGTVALGETYTFSIYAKSSERSIVWITGFGESFRYFDLSSGTTSSPSNSTIEALGDGWFRCSTAITKSNTTGSFTVGISTSTSSPTYSGDGTSGIFIWGAQLELGSTATAYQRVGSTFDVTEAGQPDNFYLSFDGIDDSMSTPSIDFTGTDKMTVFAGVQSFANQISNVVELSANAGSATFNGVFQLFHGSSRTYDFRSGANVKVFSGAGAPTANATVLTGLGNIEGPLAALRQDGSSVSQNTSSQGSGAYGNHPLFIGSRGGSSLRFNGQIYSLIVRGALTDLPTIQRTERYVAAKTAGVSL